MNQSLRDQLKKWKKKNSGSTPKKNNPPQNLQTPKFEDLIESDVKDGNGHAYISASTEAR